MSTMQTQPVSHRALLERLLPIDRLPIDLRVRVQQALEQNDPRHLELAALDAIKALEARGLVRGIDTSESDRRRFRNLLSGELITLQREAASADAVVTVPLPVVAGDTPAPIETTRELVGLATRILTEDGDRVAEVGQIIELLCAYGRDVLGCDSMHFFTVEDHPESDFDALDHSDSPFVQAIHSAWSARRNQIYVVHDRGAEDDWRSAAAIRLGTPGGVSQGILEARSERPRFFNTQRLALLELVAEAGRELLANASRLQQLVFIDSRTQIFNKAFFDIQLEHFLARSRREGRQMVLAIADIDDFKSFNTRFGYQGGDQVLYRVAQILKGHVRPFDCVARWGGEEFAILLAPPVELDDARNICDRLRLSIQQTSFVVGDLDDREHRTGVTISVGGSIYPSDGQTADQLWRHANEALLAAKAAGKNLVRFRDRDGTSRSGKRK
jgi:diguanylate cyclase (GGDEF)-like protein